MWKLYGKQIEDKINVIYTVDVATGNYYCYVFRLYN